MAQRQAGSILEDDARERVPGYLNRWTGLPTTVVENLDLKAATRESDQLDLVLQSGPLWWVAEVKGRSDVATISRAVHQLERYVDALKHPVNTAVVPLIIVPFMTGAGERLCEERGMSWLDLSGNANIHVEGETAFHVRIEGKPNLYRKKGRPKNTFAPKASRLSRFLLMNPGKSFLQQEIAEATGLDKGYLSKLVGRLEKQDLLFRDSEGKSFPTDYDLLLDAWVEGNQYGHERITGHVSARSGDQLARTLSDALTSVEAEYALTGLAAAWAYTKAAGFRTCSVYLPRLPDEKLLNGIGFRRESREPNLVLLLPDDPGVFHGRRKIDGLWCVAPVQAYVDLSQEAERAAEFRAELKQQYLTWSSSDRD